MKIALLSLLLQLPVFAAAPLSVSDAEHVTIYRKAGEYSACPRFHKFPDGSLHVRFGAGVTSSHLEPRRKPNQFISKDGALNKTSPIRFGPQGRHNQVA